MILVTGATGHIGNVLVRKLSERYPQETIRILLQHGERLDPFDGLELQLYYGDIRKDADVRRAVNGARLVFHLAGLIETAPRKPQLLYQVNIGGTRNVVEACLDYQVERLVYVSSIHALAELPDGQSICEIKDFPCADLLGPYARSKSNATAVVYDGIARGLDAVIVFPSGVVGPFDNRLSEVGRMLKHLSSQGWLKLVMSFNGAYDFVDVRDVVNGMLAAARIGRRGEGYILSGFRVTLREVIRIERAALGQRQPKIFFAPNWLVKAAAWLTHGLCRIIRIKPFFTPYSVSVLESNSNISHEKAARELGYEPRPLMDTFRDSLLWMQENGQIRRPRKHAPGMSRSSNT